MIRGNLYLKNQLAEKQSCEHLESSFDKSTKFFFGRRRMIYCSLIENDKN